MSHAAQGPRIGVIGSHGAVGRTLVGLLRSEQCQVVCGNRSRRSPEEESVLVDAYRRDSVRDFASGCDAVVSCAGPSYLIKDRVAAALPSGAVYIDPFGGNVFDQYAGGSPCIINAGCTPGLSGILTKYLAARFEKLASVTVCCGGREQGGVSGFADVILSTRGGYGLPNQMLVAGRPAPYTRSSRETQDTDAFPEDGTSLRSPFVTDELRRVAEECSIPQLTGLIVVPDQESLHLLLKAMTHTDTEDPGEFMKLVAQIDSAKFRLDAGKENWFAMQVSVRGYTGGMLQRSAITLRSRDSSELTAVVLAQAVLHALKTGCAPGAHWGYELLDAVPVLGALRAAGVQVRDIEPEETGTEPADPERIESGFL